MERRAPETLASLGNDRPSACGAGHPLAPEVGGTVHLTVDRLVRVGLRRFERTHGRRTSGIFCGFGRSQGESVDGSRLAALSG
jgi:hypothetical protein